MVYILQRNYSKNYNNCQRSYNSRYYYYYCCSSIIIIIIIISSFVSLYGYCCYSTTLTRTWTTGSRCFSSSSTILTQARRRSKINIGTSRNRQTMYNYCYRQYKQQQQQQQQQQNRFLFTFLTASKRTSITKQSLFLLKSSNDYYTNFNSNIRTMTTTTTKTIDSMSLLSSVVEGNNDNNNNNNNTDTTKQVQIDNNNNSKTYEVEKKFSLIGCNIEQLQQQLYTLQFYLSQQILITDWYYDTMLLLYDYPLTTNDYWLRYRIIRHNNNNNNSSTNSTNDGIWQLKRRCYPNNNDITKSSSSSGQKVNNGSLSISKSKQVSVYEEIEGIDAIVVALSLINDTNNISNNGNIEYNDTSQTTTTTTSSSSSFSSSHTRMFDYSPNVVPTFSNTIEQLLNNTRLIPIARIYTQRSSWNYNPPTKKTDAVANNRNNNYVSNQQDTTIATATTTNVKTNDGMYDTNKKSILPYYHDMTIDLDTTDYGHAVGEVEVIVTSQNDIIHAQERINQFLQQHLLVLVSSSLKDNDNNNNNSSSNESNQSTDYTKPFEYTVPVKSTSTTTTGNTGSTAGAAAVGKLEYYIQLYRPELFSKLKQSGVL